MKITRTAASGLAGGTVAVVGVVALVAAAGGPATAAARSSAVGIVGAGQSSFTANRSSSVPAGDFISGVSGLSTDTGTSSAEVRLGAATLFGAAPSGTIRLSGLRASCDDGRTTVSLGGGSTAGGASIAGTYRSARSVTVTPTVSLTIGAGGDGSVTAVTARLTGGSDTIQSFTIGRVSCSAASGPTASPTRTSRPTASSRTSRPTALADPDPVAAADRLADPDLGRRGRPPRRPGPRRRGPPAPRPRHRRPRRSGPPRPSPADPGRRPGTVVLPARR